MDDVQGTIQLGLQLKERFGIKIGSAVLLAERLREIGIETTDFELTVPVFFGRILGYRVPWYGVKAVPKQLRGEMKTVVSSGRAMHTVPAKGAALIFQFFIENRPFKRGRNKRKGGE